MRERIGVGRGEKAGGRGDRPMEGAVGEGVILEMALRKELYSRQFYEQLHEFVEREDSRLLVRELIEDEARHYGLLMDVRRTGRFGTLGDPVEAEGLGTPDYLVEEEIRSLSGPEEIVKLAIRREEEAEEFYLSRIGFLETGRLRELYRRLAREEAGHRERLLRTYDDLVVMNIA